MSNRKAPPPEGMVVNAALKYKRQWYSGESLWLNERWFLKNGFGEVKLCDKERQHEEVTIFELFPYYSGGAWAGMAWRITNHVMVILGLPMLIQIEKAIAWSQEYEDVTENIRQYNAAPTMEKYLENVVEMPVGVMEMC